MTVARCSLISEIKNMQDKIKKGRKNKNKEKIILILLIKRHKLIFKRLPSGQELRKRFTILVSNNVQRNDDKNQLRSVTTEKKQTLTISQRTCNDVLTDFHEKYSDLFLEIEQESQIDDVLNHLIEDS